MDLVKNLFNLPAENYGVGPDGVSIGIFMTEPFYLKSAFLVLGQHEQTHGEGGVRLPAQTDPEGKILEIQCYGARF